MGGAAGDYFAPYPRSPYSYQVTHKIRAPRQRGMWREALAPGRSLERPLGKPVADPDADGASVVGA